MRCILKIGLLVLVLVSPIAHVHGGEERLPIRFSWNSSVASHYVGYLGYNLSHDPVTQNEVAAVHANTRASVWWCAGTNDRVFSSDRADEVDLFLSWRMKHENFALSPEIVYQCFFPLERSRGDALVPRLKLFYTEPTGIFRRDALTASLQLENRLTLITFDRRPTVTLGLSDVWTLDHGITWTIGVSALGDAGNKKADSGVIVQWKTELSVAFTKQATGQVYVKYFDPIGINNRDGRKEESVIGLGLTITF